MKKFVLFLLLVPCLSVACEKYVIGFRGINNIFDENAFRHYAKKHNSCSLVYSWNQTHTAANFINQTKKPYQLYGFSKGASSIGTVLKLVKRKPYSIVTVGAYHTANVNYGVYNIPTRNFFDYSGKRNVSPGIHIRGIDHTSIQSYVNKHYFGIY